MIKLDRRKCADLKPYENNARINDKAIDAVANSIRDFGMNNPILIDENNVVVAGHARLKALEKLHIEETPVLVLSDLSEDKIKAFRIADNSTAQLAEWDLQKLQAELDSFDIEMEQYGLQEQLDKIQQQIDADMAADLEEDEVPEPDEINQPNVRQIKELISRKDIFYKEADPNAFQKFARKFRHWEGIWAGQPIELNFEQRYMVACILGIKIWNEAEKRFVRYFNEFNLFVARKWGKDTFIVPLICYFVGIDKEPSAWCQILAENETQAKRTFDIVKDNIKDEPLSEWFSGTGKTTKTITVPKHTVK